MHCDEYQKLELARRIAAHSFKDAYGSGTEKRIVVGDPEAVALELKRLEAEIETHLASCQICMGC